MAFAGAILILQSAFGAGQLSLVQTKLNELKETKTPVFSIRNSDWIRAKLDDPNSVFVVVNKHRQINPKSFEPGDLVRVEDSKTLDNSRKLALSVAAAGALEEMAKALSAAGQGKLFLNSAYRSYDYQAELFLGKVKQYGKSEALLRSARAGYSEHQTGLAADVSVPEQGCAILACFGETPAGQWIQENSWRYGFIVRYLESTTAITGYSYEPWHIRYVGKEVARLYHENGMQTLEEFWGLPAAPDYLSATTESTSN
ncbi:MAG: D-alanyl-D-alanine carboxypeptidase family protein [Actinobacteria bacterium]|nr:D-alanyl-D-alanine carboxypeptidase family protein [Actinomycetota bacterium]